MENLSSNNNFYVPKKRKGKIKGIDTSSIKYNFISFKYEELIFKSLILSRLRKPKENFHPSSKAANEILFKIVLFPRIIKAFSKLKLV